MTRGGVEAGLEVEVRSLGEIVATLDRDGTLDGLPFMPEMAQFCGQRFVVDRTANRVCEEGTGEMRRLDDAVFLRDVRCDGSSHDGCERRCLIIWKEGWLAPTGSVAPASPVPPEASSILDRLPTRVDDRYLCQSTELVSATRPMSRWDLRPLVHDVLKREISLWEALRSLALTVGNKALVALGRGGIARLTGTTRRADRGSLGLIPGERIRVKSRREIRSTLDERGTNRGLSFEYDMLRHCGKSYRVAYPVRRIILESSGEMVELPNTVALDGVVCEGRLRRCCPRQNYLYWREGWLDRAAADGSGSGGDASPGASDAG